MRRKPMFAAFIITCYTSGEQSIAGIGFPFILVTIVV